jgi:ribonuclease G
MSKELVIGSNRHETKVAILEDDQLVELFFQRGSEYSLAGSIHKGRVTRVLPGMQSAFVDLGLERDTFLYVSDFFEENEDIDTVSEEKSSGRRDQGNRRDRDRNERAQSRSIDTRPNLEVVAPPAEEPIAFPDIEEDAEEENSVVPETSAGGFSHGVLSESQSPEAQRLEGDRGRGDRRGRRSRRRRSRGHGFPDNKYAQPGQTEQRSEPVQSQLPSEDNFVAEVESDVIILPGESLAKYRHLTAAGDEASSQSVDDEIRETEQAIGEGAADEEELTAEAEEIELADRILSHRGADVLEEEATLAEVKQEQHVSPFIIGDLEEEPESVLPVYETASAAVYEIDILPPPPARSVEEADPLTDAPDGSGPVRFADAEEEGLSAGERAEDELSEEVEQAEVVEFPSNGELAAHSGEETQTPGADPSVATEFSLESETAPAQSAVVREQGDRYLHRVGGRRMRRRRGGNRGGQNFSQRHSQQPAPNTFADTRNAGAVAGEAGPSGTAVAPEGRADLAAESRRESGEERSAELPERVMPSISELLKPGQEIIVQIAKEPLGQKGARITSHIALPGRYVVFMPSVTHLGVSRKIASDEERQRLKRILQNHREGTTGGFIVRTAGEGVTEEEIAADMDFLYKLWLDIRQKAEKKPAPALLHYDLDVVQRILRDQVTEDFKSIWVDNEDMYENVVTFMQRFQPALVNRVKMYTRSAPIFDALGITPELEKALRPKVWLKSGGYIVINQTEALVAIDINTGKYVGKSNRLEDTIVKTNIEAVKEIVRQIRLRDLGGIIVVDFIDMDERKNRQKVMQALEEAMHVDKAPYKILQFNDFGLVAITRKRVKQSLERALCSPCLYCEGAGYVKSVHTVIGEILVEAQKLSKAIEGKDVLLRVHPEVAKVLKANNNRYLEEIEEILARPVLVKGDQTLHIEKYDLG